MTKETLEAEGDSRARFCPLNLIFTPNVSFATNHLHLLSDTPEF